MVLDVASGLTGAIDIPVLPSEIAKARELVQPPAPPCRDDSISGIVAGQVKTFFAPKDGGVVDIPFELGQSGNPSLERR